MTMTTHPLTAVPADSATAHPANPGPRSGGPTPRRTFTPAQKLDHLCAYEDAAARREGGAYLREHGLYSSQILEWRKLRDAGVLAGKKPGEKIGRLSAEQIEIAKLRRKLALSEQRLATTEVALTIMGKAHELLEGISKSSRDETPHTNRS